MEDEGFYVKVEKMGRWERPRWVSVEIARKAEELAERLMRVIDEFNKNTTRLKTELQLRYCKPSVCEDTRVFYDVMLKESGEEVATITFEWNMTDDIKSILYVMTDEYVTSLEDTLNILFLAGKLAKEFYSNTPT
jgi:hypothetical protein